MSLSLCSFPFLPFPPLSVFLCLSVKQVIVRGLQSGRSCTQWELFLQTGTLAEDARRRVHSVLDFSRWTRGEPGTKLPNHTAPHRGRLGQTPNLQEVSKEKFRTLIWNHRNLNLKLPCKKNLYLELPNFRNVFFWVSLGVELQKEDPGIQFWTLSFTDLFSSQFKVKSPLFQQYRGPYWTVRPGYSLPSSGGPSRPPGGFSLWSYTCSKPRVSLGRFSWAF